MPACAPDSCQRGRRPVVGAFSTNTTLLISPTIDNHTKMSTLQLKLIISAINRLIVEKGRLMREFLVKNQRRESRGLSMEKFAKGRFGGFGTPVVAARASQTPQKSAFCKFFHA